jgi:hypothetical protein
MDALLDEATQLLRALWAQAEANGLQGKCGFLVVDLRNENARAFAQAEMPSTVEVCQASSLPYACRLYPTEALLAIWSNFGATDAWAKLLAEGPGVIPAVVLTSKGASVASIRFAMMSKGGSS